MNFFICLQKLEDKKLHKIVIVSYCHMNCLMDIIQNVYTETCNIFLVGNESIFSDIKPCIFLF